MGFKIKEYREAAGLTKSQLSRKSGISRGTIIALESNKKTTTTLKTLSRIAAALDTTIENIFFDDCV